MVKRPGLLLAESNKEGCLLSIIMYDGATQSTGLLLKPAANHRLHGTTFSAHEYSSTKRIVWQTQFKLAIVKVSFKMNENEEFRRLGSYPRFFPLEPSF